MTGLERISHEENAEVLRHARAVRLGNTEQKDSQRAVTESELQLGLK